ncbi:Ger(x)C family spore germination protein [Sporosarcina sp. E16_3]|uniref:Ger(x)C family spore germination protein n=1 Tax=Sporosarcina sp. E16_3 TaxID=2789293 RepID=UPI001A90E42A|nr:Ger(x)C family spore germination protein [Sporosarcina sp. E16_3]MBO0600262.1 Ger(x)C family spore germination protein [Sporosarcina sp. E16_3]
MKRNACILLICSFLLSGCWDEKQYKDVTIVSLIGVGGKLGDVKAQFAFPTFEDGSISYSTSLGSGKTLREARNDANHRTMEGLDIASLQVLLIEEDTAKSDLYEYIDMLYRDPRNRLGAHMAIVQGELTSYFKPSAELGDDIATYYSSLLDTAIRYTFIPDIDIQQVSTYLFAEDISLSLPYIKIGKESGIPEIAGTALFNKREFTGETLDKKESILLNLLKKEQGRYARLSYMWKSGGEESPLTVEVVDNHKQWKVSNDKIEALYKLKLSVEEFPHDSLDNKKVIKEVEEFLSKELTKEFNGVVKKLQEAKSDAVGFGRPVRAFHPALWGKGDWTDTFATLPISVKVKAEVLRTDILN